MRNKTDAFMETPQSFFDACMPYSAGLSGNTARSCKYAFRLLLEHLYSVRGTAADKAAFRLLDQETVSGCLSRLEEGRGCSAAARSQRLAALPSFAMYAQNRDLEAASSFMRGLKKIPAKKQKAGPRTVFSMDEVSVLLRIPAEGKHTGLRGKVLLNLMYASGARAQEICGLKVRDIQAQPDGVRLTITGKGGKSRRTMTAGQCGTLLCQCLSYRRIDGMPDRHVFSSQTHEHMTVSCIEGIFKNTSGRQSSRTRPCSATRITRRIR